MYASVLNTLTSCVAGLVALCTLYNHISSFIRSLKQRTTNIDYFISTILKQVFMLEKLPLAYNEIIGFLKPIFYVHFIYLLSGHVISEVIITE